MIWVQVKSYQDTPENREIAKRQLITMKRRLDILFDQDFRCYQCKRPAIGLMIAPHHGTHAYCEDCLTHLKQEVTCSQS